MPSRGLGSGKREWHVRSTFAAWAHAQRKLTKADRAEPTATGLGELRGQLRRLELASWGLPSVMTHQLPPAAPGPLLLTPAAPAYHCLPAPCAGLEDLPGPELSPLVNLTSDGAMLDELLKTLT